jgi:hypothetical protein
MKLSAIQKQLLENAFKLFEENHSSQAFLIFSAGCRLSRFPKASYDAIKSKGRSEEDAGLHDNVKLQQEFGRLTFSGPQRIFADQRSTFA